MREDDADDQVRAELRDVFDAVAHRTTATANRSEFTEAPVPETTPPPSWDRHPAKGQTRWMVLAAAAAAAAVVLLVGVLAARATRDDETISTIDTRPRPSEYLPSVPATAGSALPGWQVVTYRGVQLQVPEVWPLHDGSHVPRCTGPFAGDAAVYLGPDLADEFVSCPNIPGRDAPHDGVWMQPGGPTTATTATPTASGQTVQLSVPSQPGWRDVWFNGVHIQIGTGPDESIATHIMNSITPAPLPDTAPPDACELNPAPDTMPTPERLDRQIVLNRGQITLDPPESADVPGIPPEQAWSPAGSTGHRSPLEEYRLILTRYSSPFPASPDGHGGYSPNDQHVLRWVILATPNTAGCGQWSVWTVDTTTGASGGSSWAPGP